MKTKLIIALTLLFAVFIAACENTGSPADTAANNTATTVQEPAAPEVTEADATAALKELSTAVASNDVTALEKIYADDYHIVNNEGVIQTKAERLETMKSGAVKYQSVDFNNPKIRIYGNNAVVVTDSVGKMTVDGKDVETNFVATIIFAKSADGLRVVSSQLTDKAKKE